VIKKLSHREKPGEREKGTGGKVVEVSGIRHRGDFVPDRNNALVREIILEKNYRQSTER